MLKGKRGFEDLTEAGVALDVRQKGVDMRIGLDIASWTFKKQASKIVLMAGDADFVPAAKLARREGIDFVLRPQHLQPNTCIELKASTQSSIGLVQAPEAGRRSYCQVYGESLH